MKRLLLILPILAIAASPLLAATAKKTAAPDPLISSIARFAAFSMGTSPHVAKLVITLGRSKWYFDHYGRRLYRRQAAQIPMGGRCGRWVVARANAFDRYGGDLYGSVHLLLEYADGEWKGRMMGHGFSDRQLLRLGVDRKSLACLRDHGL
jgi:hypothetical protein